MHDTEKKVETTGHQWDDDEGYPLQEYNNPLPRWWLYTFYATILFAVVYWVLYPSWPMVHDYARGVLGWSTHKELDEDLAAAALQKKPFDDRLAGMSLENIAKDPQMLQYAQAGGKTLFGNNCASCHGMGGAGTKAKGFPVLVDDDWLFGGTLADIQETITNGRSGTMPAFLETSGGAFKSEQVKDLAQYVLKISSQPADQEAAKRGEALFKGDAGCVGCHGEHGQGALKDTVNGGQIDRSVGAPNLTDKIWLFGGDPATLYETIAHGRTGHMPAWGKGSAGSGGRLSPLAIKQVAIYVHALGGGQ